MGAYEEVLDHIAEPASPSGRAEAESITLEDYEALWFAEQLREYAHYGDASDVQSDIAIGYTAYINTQVRENEQRHVDIYTHTAQARSTLWNARSYAFENKGRRFPLVVYESIGDLLSGS